MASQLNIDGNIIILEQDITYNFQIGDIADFSRLKSNYTSSFSIPRTSENIRIFESLGIPSDMSSYPYNIRNVLCMDGYASVYSGNLVVLGSDELNYQCTVISGIHDLASILSDRTLYDIGIRLIPKSVENVADNSNFPTGMVTVPNTFFYLPPFVANSANIDSNNQYRANIDVSGQAFRLDYLIQECFDSVGFTYTFPSSIDMIDETLVVPNPPLVDISSNGFLGVTASHNSTFAPTSPIPGDSDLPPYGGWDSVFVNTPPFYQSGAYNFECATAGAYVFVFDYFFANVQPIYGDDTGQWQGAKIELKVNGNTIATFSGNQFDSSVDSQLYKTIVDLNSGDIISITVSRPDSIGFERAVWFNRGITSFNIYVLELDESKERDTLSLRVTDFIKEICYRYFLIPVQTSNHIDFISLYDIFNDWTYIDWSDKYLKRTNEIYDYGYSINNYLRHSYVLEGDETFDLNLISNNNNTSISSNIVDSKICAPRFRENQFYDYEIYEVEEDKDGNVKYKTNNRYFFAKGVTEIRNPSTRMLSRTLYGGVVSQGRKFIFPEYTAAFSDSDRWKSLERVLTNTKVQTIELNLSAIDINEMSFNRLYYFKQEQSYYILSNLRYTKNQKAIGEFVRVLCLYGWIGEGLSCNLDANGYNTGIGVYSQLRNAITNEVKPNVPGTDGYIPSSELSECDAPVLIPRLAQISNDAPYTLSIYGNGQKYKVRIIQPQGGGVTQVGDTYEGTDETHIYTWTNEIFFGVKDIEYFGGRENVTRIEFNGLYTDLLNLIGFNNLVHLELGNATPTAISTALNFLNGTGNENGYLSYDGIPTSESLEDYNSLISKGWTIDGNIPS